MRNSIRRNAMRLSAGAGLLSLVFMDPCIAQSRKMTQQLLTQRAEIVAVGKVISRQSQWEDGRSRIVTYVTVSVDEYLKGTAGNVVTIATPGGEVGGFGELYSHSVSFLPDEEVVVFVARDKRGRYRVTGGPQGKLSVTRDRATGKATVGGGRSLDDFAAGIRQISQANGN